MEVVDCGDRHVVDAWAACRYVGLVLRHAPLRLLGRQLVLLFLLLLCLLLLRLLLCLLVLLLRLLLLRLLLLRLLLLLLLLHL